MMDPVFQLGLQQAALSTHTITWPLLPSPNVFHVVLSFIFSVF